MISITAREDIVHANSRSYVLKNFAVNYKYIKDANQ